MRLLVAFILGLLAAPVAADAQPPRKVPRIGVLEAGVPAMFASWHEAFRQGLRELGYVEGQTVVIAYRYAEGKFERLPELAEELVRLQVDLILASAAPETGAAKRATQSIPIVFASHGGPVESGHVASLARPGGNITGVSAITPERAAKRLELLKEAVPRIARVAVLWNAANPAKAVDWRQTQVAARALGLTLQSHEVRGPGDFASAFAGITKQRPDALIVLGDPLLLSFRTSIVAFAARQRLPAMVGGREWVVAGGLMSYAPSFPDLYRRAAWYVHKILEGARPAELAVAEPTKLELMINLKTAKALDLTIPQSVLLRADEVIE